MVRSHLYIRNISGLLAPSYRWPTNGALAIDSKLRGCDLVALKVEDIAPNGYAIDRATVRQKKTGRSIKFEITEHTRQSIDQYLNRSKAQ